MQSFQVLNVQYDFKRVLPNQIKFLGFTSQKRKPLCDKLIPRMMGFCPFKKNLILFKDNSLF